MKKIISILCLIILVGCVKRTPWKIVSKEGPWVSPGKKALIYSRTEKGLYDPKPKRKLAFEMKQNIKTPVVPIEYKIDLLFESSDIISSWPDTGGYTGRFLGRIPPLALNLVSLDPIVLVGASEKYDIAEYSSTQIFTNHFGSIPISTNISLVGKSVMAIVDNNGKLIKYDFKASELPKEILLEENDIIILTSIKNQLIVKRAKKTQGKE